jgi:hypothetical protein
MQSDTDLVEATAGVVLEELFWELLTSKQPF